MSIVEFNRPAGSMFVSLNGRQVVLDRDDLATVGAVALALLAAGRDITPEIAPMLLPSTTREHA